MIMIVFSLAGMGVTFIRKPLFVMLGLDTWPLWLQILVYIPLVMPIYQISLMFFACVCGQFSFFWNKQKEIGRWIKQKFSPQKSSTASQNTYSIK